MNPILSSSLPSPRAKELLKTDSPIQALPWPRGDEQLRHLEIDTGVLMALEVFLGTRLESLAGPGMRKALVKVLTASSLSGWHLPPRVLSPYQGSLSLSQPFEGPGQHQGIWEG